MKIILEKGSVVNQTYRFINWGNPKLLLLILRLIELRNDYLFENKHERQTKMPPSFEKKSNFCFIILTNQRSNRIYNLHLLYLTQDKR